MRAWGPIEWLLAKLPKPQGNLLLLGSLAAEERCKASAVLAHAQNADLILLLRIDDPPSRYTERIAAKIASNLEALSSSGIGPLKVESTDLFARDEIIVDAYELLWNHQGNADSTLWLDVSCLPKRFFFFFVKLALRDPRVKTLVVSYTQPEPGRYTPDHLAEDPAEVQPLPAFGLLKEEPEQLVVSVGFEALGLAQLLDEFRDKSRQIFFLIPFPPGQPYSRRIWQSVQRLGFPRDANLRRLHALDPFEAYEVIRNTIDPQSLASRPPALAPYGPKPISLGMCLFALQYDAAVYYTQPTVYHPDYTLGVGRTWGYCLKLNGALTWP